MAPLYAPGNETSPGYPMVPVPTSTPACSGWTCLSEAEQFGVIMGVLAAMGLLGVLAVWFCRGQRWTRDRTRHTTDIQLQPCPGYGPSYSMPPYNWPHSAGPAGPPLPPHQQYFLQYSAYPAYLTYPVAGAPTIEGPSGGGGQGIPSTGAAHPMPGGPNPLASHPVAPYPGVNMPTSQTYPHMPAGHPAANNTGPQAYPHVQATHPAANMTGSQSVPHVHGPVPTWQYQQQPQYTPVPPSDGAPFQHPQQQAYYGPRSGNQCPDAGSPRSAPYVANLEPRRPTLRQRFMRMLRLPSGHASTVSATTTAPRSIPRTSTSHTGTTPRGSYQANQTPRTSRRHSAPSGSDHLAYMSGALRTPTPRSHASRRRAATPGPSSTRRSRRRPRSPSASPDISSEEGTGDEGDDDDQSEVSSTRVDVGRGGGSSDRSWRGRARGAITGESESGWSSGDECARPEPPRSVHKGRGGGSRSRG